MFFNGTSKQKQQYQHLQNQQLTKRMEALGKMAPSAQRDIHTIMRLAPKWHPSVLQTGLILNSIQAVTYIL